MKNKWSLLFTLVFCFCILCKVNGQTNASSIVVLRGYVVIQFDRQEVINRFNVKNKNSTPIDKYQKTFFLPFGETGLEVITDSLNVLHRDNIVFLPSKETNELIGEFCKDKAFLISNNFPSLKEDNTYFQIKGKSNDNYLYQYFYIESKAIKVNIANNSKNSFKLNIIYNKAAPNLVCNFIFDTMITQPIHAINSKKIQLFEVEQKITPHESGHLLPKN